MDLRSSEGNIPFEELDRDGAIAEAASKVDGSTRRSFLQKVAVFTGTGAAMGALGVLGGAAGARTSAGSSSQDIDILNYALALEYLESSFYNEANSKAGLTGELKTFGTTVASHENAHVAGLKKALGSSAIKEPSFNFQGTTGSSAKFAPTSWALENEGTKAYLGQAANISNPQYLVVAGQILSVEARHSAWIGDILFRQTGDSKYLPAPEAFQSFASMQEVLGVVNSLHFTAPLSPSAIQSAIPGEPGMTG
jgi:rubrerythrin